MVDIDLHVPSHSIEQVEDIHLVLEHLITKALREKALAMVMEDSTLAILSEVKMEKERTALD